MLMQPVVPRAPSRRSQRSTRSAEADAPRFFGREAAAAHTLERLRSGSRLLTLLGASGAGKSSLLMAGILPAIRTGELDGTYDWQIVRLRPGPRPIHELAVQLTSLEGGSTGELATLREALRADPEALSDGVDLMLAGREGADRLVIAVDQFEEVFTLTDEEGERRAFIAALLHAAAVAGGRVTVLLALRADFMGRALEASRALAEAIKASQEIVLPMAATELRAAVERPALVAGLRFDDGLVDTLVHEVEGQPGDLPLLQFTLEALWRECQGGRMTWQGYRRIGELRGAIAQRADSFLASLEEADVTLARRLFGRLVRLGEGTSDTRRRVPAEELESLAPGARPLLDRLTAERLLTAGSDGVDIAHEALLKEWATLRGWIEADREILRLQQAVARAAAQWHRTGRAEDDLWRGGRLARTLEIGETRELALAEVEKEFLAASAAAEDRVREEAEARRRRELESARELAAARFESARRLRWGLAVAVVLLVAVGGLAVWARRAQQAEEEQRRAAQENLDRAVEVADLISFKVDRDLEDVAGAATVRRDLLDAGQELLRRLTVGRGEEGDLDARRSRIVLHNQRGDLALNHDNLELAGREYERAFELSKQLVAAKPGGALFLKDLSVSHIKIGEVLRLKGDLSGALVEYRASFEIAQRLAEQGFENASWQRDLSVSQEKIGDVLSAQGNLAGALQVHRASFEIRKRLADKDPSNVSWQRDLSVSHSRIGDVLRAQGDLDGALREYRADFEVAQRLADQDPGNASWQLDLSISHSRIGEVLSAQGDLDGALVEFRAYFEIAQRLAALDSSNASWQHDLSVSHSRIGDVLRAQGDLDGALVEFRAYFEIAKRLADQDPGNASWQRDLSVSHNKMGDVLRAQGDLDGALVEFRASFEIAKRLAEQDPGNASWQLDLAVSCWRVAHAVDATTAGRSEAVAQMKLGARILRDLDEAGRLAPPQQPWLARFENALEGMVAQ